MEDTRRNQTKIEALLFSLPEGVIFKIFPEGKSWERNGKRRIYFTPEAVLKGAGYDWVRSRYKDISDPTCEGKKIAVEELVRARMSASRYANFFFDLTHKRVSRNTREEAQHDFERFILKRIKRRAEEMNKEEKEDV